MEGRPEVGASSAGELRVGGLPDLAHAAFAEEGCHVVVAEAGAGGESHRQSAYRRTARAAHAPLAEEGGEFVVAGHSTKVTVSGSADRRPRL